ncbi:hypothetical protein D3C86_1672240 [compost metagenome]
MSDGAEHFGDALRITSGQQLAGGSEGFLAGRTQGGDLQMADLLDAFEELAVHLLQQLEIGLLGRLQFFRIEEGHG